MNAPTRIFVGDLVRALSEVGGPDGKNWPEIAKLLGMTWVDASLTVPQVSKSESSQLRDVKPSRSVTPSLSETRHEVPDTEDVGEPIDFDFTQTEAAPDVISLPSKPPQREPEARQILTLQPLLDPLWERGILVEAVATVVREGDIDITATVELIARGRSLQDAPREVIPSVSKGCQLLIDTGVGMQPFLEDTRQLTNSIQRAVGTGHTTVFTFIDCPIIGVLTTTYEDSMYTPPQNGAIVLALSDLCCGGPRGTIRDAKPEEWLLISKQIRDAGSSLVVLNPYPPDRWPSSLIGRIAILHWDRSARAATVRQTRRRRRD
jgi:hypothetical protein